MHAGRGIHLMSVSYFMYNNSSFEISRLKKGAIEACSAAIFVCTPRV